MHNARKDDNWPHLRFVPLLARLYEEVSLDVRALNWDTWEGHAELTQLGHGCLQSQAKKSRAPFCT